MRRKIIKQKSAYTITLPVKWIRENNLEKSNEVDVTEENTGLLITAQMQASNRRTYLDFKKGNVYYYRILIENEYLRGATDLDIKFPDQNSLRIIQETVANLIGFEILDLGKSTCRVGQTAMPTVQEFKAILNRLFNVLKYCQESVYADVVANDFSHTAQVEKFESDTRRYSLFCRRILHSQSIVSRTDEFLWDLLLERLVITGYEHFFMYQKLAAVKENTKVRPEIIKLYKKASAMFLLFTEMFFKKKVDDFTTINEQWQEIFFKEGHSIIAKNKKESIILFHAINLSKMIWLISQPNTITIEMPK